MTNNDILRRLRYAMELDNPMILACFAEGGARMGLARLAGMLKDEEEDGFEPLSDGMLTRFLDGLVTKRRGKRADDGRAPPPGSGELTNNRILRSLRIALELKDTDILTIMELADTPLSKAELSALFRREDHRNYQPCGNQFLRNFIRGLGIWHRKR